MNNFYDYQYPNAKDVLLIKSKLFALKIIKLSTYLSDEKREFVLSRQIMKSGTSIGANIRESKYSESKLDFIHKLKVALKESNETEYWLELLVESNMITDIEFSELYELNKELLKLLISSINTLKSKL